MTLRTDLDIISQWVMPQSRVLDLGCGDGTLLARLTETKNVLGYGIEINQDDITACFAKGVNAIEQDIDHGLDNFPDNQFDQVIMTQALQSMQHPEAVLDDMLRVGHEAIITFPNFGYWRVRGYLLFKGRMPVSSTLPYQWYDTPNIHLCTVRDFETHCRINGFRILERALVDKDHHGGLLAQLMPNLFTEIAIYRVTK